MLDSFYLSRYGLEATSLPIVVLSPCPGNTRTSSGNCDNILRLWIIINIEPPPISVLPIVPWKRVSPVKSTFSCSQ